MSPFRKQEIKERQTAVLGAARCILLKEGFYSLTMERLAKESGYPKGTLYQQFTSKEDVLLLLALEYLRDRMALIKRAIAWPGRAREKMGAIGEAIALFVRSTPDKSRIIHMAGGIIREKAGAERIQRLLRREEKLAGILKSILQQAVDDGDLALHDDDSIERAIFGFWATVDGTYVLIENEIPQHVLGLEAPVRDLWLIYNLMADAWGWKPLFHEQDWEETMAEIRRRIFPEEAQALYGEGCWYGDAGREHPAVQAGRAGEPDPPTRTAMYYSLIDITNAREGDSNHET
jgi:AcrR family transcriptional regulator